MPNSAAHGTTYPMPRAASPRASTGHSREVVDPPGSVNDGCRRRPSGIKKKTYRARMSRRFPAIRRGQWGITLFRPRWCRQKGGGQEAAREVSAVLLARLAVDSENKGQGLGEYLLMHALQSAVRTVGIIGVQCVIVDAIADQALASMLSMTSYAHTSPVAGGVAT